MNHNSNANIIGRRNGNGMPLFHKNLIRSIDLTKLSGFVFLDEMGVETRPPQPDGCVTTDGVGGGVYLGGSIFEGSKWAVAFRKDNHVEVSFSSIIGNSVTSGSVLQSYGSDKITVRSSESTVYTFTDSPTLSSLSHIDGCIWSNGESLTLVLNGIQYTTIIGEAQLIIDRLLSSFKTGIGNFYDIRFWDLSTRTAEEINTYFETNAPKFHTDTMPTEDGWTKHIWILTESNGFAAIDSGDTATKNHGTYFYDNIDIPVDTLHNYTIYPTHLQNHFDKYGYNKAAYFNGVSSAVILQNGTIADGDIFEIIIAPDMADCAIIGETTNDYIGILAITTQLLVRPNGNFATVTFSTSLLSKIPYTLTIEISGTEWIVTRSDTGEVETHDFGSVQELSYTKIGTIGAKQYKGSIYGYKNNGVWIDELNGSTTGIPTNITYPIKLPAPDPFGREDLYSGAIKLNLEQISGGNSINGIATDSVVKFSELDLTNGVAGYFASIYFNNCAYSGNPYNLPGILVNSQSVNSDSNNPYQNIISRYLNTSNISTEFHFRVYFKMKNGSIQYVRVYDRQLTLIEQSKLVRTGYLPQYP